MEKRPYRKTRRAEQQAATRQRIVEAAVGLHTTIGPARTSLSAVAERAGVQRHTLYAHFPDAEKLYRACSLHWRAAHPFPAEVPEAGDPHERLRLALAAVYDWYGSVEDAFALFVRDAHVFPAVWQERLDALDAFATRLAAPLGRSRTTRARVRHALEFETWRSLRRHGLTQRGAVEAMLDLIRGGRA